MNLSRTITTTTITVLDNVADAYNNNGLVSNACHEHCVKLQKTKPGSKHFGAPRKKHSRQEKKLAGSNSSSHVAAKSHMIMHIIFLL